MREDSFSQGIKFSSAKGLKDLGVQRPERDQVAGVE